MSQTTPNARRYDVFREIVMEIVEALKIIRALADGVNPKTAEALPPDSVYRDPLCIFALNKSAGALGYEGRSAARRALVRVPPQTAPLSSFPILKKLML
jgi:hypothetical protein